MPTPVATSLVMWPAAQIAERDGVTREAVLKLARDFTIKHDLTVTRDSRERIATINVVEYDHLRGRFGDASKIQTARPAPPASAPLPSSDSYDEAQRQAKWFEVEKRRLEVAETRKQLLRRDRYLSAVSAAATEMARHVDLLPQEADTFAAALGLDDVHAVRVALKEAAHRLRNRISASFKALAVEAPAQDDDLPSESRDDIHRSGASDL